ncbi:hypothetical protein WICMUC_004710 [Wickerhamomyces mucosus]|uniref:DUF1776-domain-containing protein n=1 Tax=Wickerhamomyces mucosus TaxID=1378264 RepID=A0A9P8T9C2_9ASCO|nr:hypothetical protein WICMUC_004710 [Wickerhamomyces mucosus]
MDPVDKTFDIIYHYSQKISNNAQFGYNYLKHNVENAINKVTPTINENINTSLSNTNSSINNSSSWKYKPGLFKSTILSSERRGLKSIALVSSLLILSYYSVKYIQKQSNYYNKHNKRRAKRLANGARKEVVLIIGSISEPMTRFIAQDLEIRGFIVYVTSFNSQSDNKFFTNESFSDIKSLIISKDNYEFNQQQINKFDYLLNSNHIPFEGANPNKLNLISVILIPDFYYPTGKFHLISQNLLNESIVSNINLPINLFQNGLVGLVEKYESNIIVLSPITSSLIPYHFIENLSSKVLSELTRLLKLDYPNLNITNLKIGLINYKSNKKGLMKGNSMRKLFYKIFDLIYKNPKNWKNLEYIGVGARFLSIFGGIIPEWLIRNYFNNYFGTL